MRPRFADTSFYVALVSESDQHHDLATTLASSWRHAIVTTEYVLVEVGNWLASRQQRSAYHPLLRALNADARTVIRWADRELFNAGAALYAAREDKAWSVTDCISFHVMQKDNLTDALTADHHFEQAGFKALLDM